ncbi:hypothetical protein DPMN_174508 [Dreissena polymorpha]|uniref:Uncharacterized protein n=1 Tax=Dreissena polymorpha TaxID=45954 RepID=A0A9D4E4U6_DREPO|nr:hypothetical protein DPMN_174508 [Dreissena polymorpha]
MKFHAPRHIIGTNIVTKIHEDRKTNVTSRVLTMKNAPPPSSHVFQPIVTIFELIQDIIETFILVKFYEDWNIIVASTELTRQMLTAHDGHKAITKAHNEHFHDDWAKDVTSRKSASLPGSHVIQLTGTIFELNSHIKETNVLTKLHDKSTA